MLNSWFDPGASTHLFLVSEETLLDTPSCAFYRAEQKLGTLTVSFLSDVTTF